MGTQMAKSLGFVSVIGRAKVADRARANSDNLEQAARNARYEFLERTAKKHKAEIVLSAHTMDDQAETVLVETDAWQRRFWLEWNGVDSSHCNRVNGSTNSTNPVGSKGSN